MGHQDIEKLLADVAEIEEAAADEDRQHYRSRRPAKAPSQVYSIRIPVDRLEELRQVARRHEVAPSVLMRTWVLERLKSEVAPKVLRVDNSFETALRQRKAAADYQKYSRMIKPRPRLREMAS